MSFYRNIFLAAGTITFAYVMLWLYKIKADENSEKDSNSKGNAVETESDQKSEENSKLVDSSNTEPEPKKRKLEESEGTMKIPKPKPNFFIAFQVYNTEIHKNIKNLQEKIIAKNPSLHPALINVATLHVTLAVTHLANETDIEMVKGKMDDWAVKNVKSFFTEPLTVKFIGVNTFNNVVAFAKIKESENYKKLTRLSEEMNTLLSSAGFSTDARGFTPHLTFIKLSKDVKLSKMKYLFKKDFISLKKCTDDFGEQAVTGIQLLSMTAKDNNGYYKCYHEINILDNKAEMDHSLCCSPIPKPRKNK